VSRESEDEKKAEKRAILRSADRGWGGGCATAVPGFGLRQCCYVVLALVSA